MREQKKDYSANYFIIVIVCMIASILSCIFILDYLSSKNSKNDTISITSAVSSSIAREFMQPITVSSAISKDHHILELLRKGSMTSAWAIEEDMAAELSSILKGFGYNMVCLVADDTKAYYTYNGLAKFVDAEKDPYDKWYQDFMESDRKMELNVDTDPIHNGVLSVFVNEKIYDEKGKMVGVSSIGVRMDKLQQILHTMEEQYNIRIYLTDRNGVIQVAADTNSIEAVTIDNEYFSKVNVNDTYYENEGEFSRAARYLDRLNWYLVVEDNKPNKIDVLSVITPSIIIFIIGLALMLVTFRMSRKEAAAKGTSIALSSLGDVYVSLYLIDLEEGTIDEIKSPPELQGLLNDEVGIKTAFHNLFHSALPEDQREPMLEFTDIDTLVRRLDGRRYISKDFLTMYNGWCRAKLIVEGEDVRDVKQVLFVVEHIDEFKQEEERILRDSLHDNMTGCYNRRAYEKDYHDKISVPKESNFVYASVDVNGLKQVNDELGHAAGDELIAGAGECLNRCLGAYGKVYRTGGDEFVAIIFVEKDKLEFIKKDVKNAVAAWRGHHVDNLAVSCGYASKLEFPTLSIKQLGHEADKRMYDDKARYYQNKGLDRRGIQSAYAAMCASYVKILKVDLTADAFVPIKITEGEAVEAKGYSHRISEWLSGYAMSGEIFHDDVPTFMSRTSLSYLREFFEEGHIEFVMRYRRKYKDSFVYVLMEMIRAKEYTPERKVVYLYVKNVGKE